jgi:hypothetical protein
MDIPHNQTHPDALQNEDGSAPGTAAFLVADVNRDEGLPLKVEILQKITYPSAVKKAEFATAFKWVRGDAYVSARICKGTCSAQVPCWELLCWCIDGTCQKMG